MLFLFCITTAIYFRFEEIPCFFALGIVTVTHIFDGHIEFPSYLTIEIDIIKIESRTRLSVSVSIYKTVYLIRARKLDPSCV